jgi:hypothetical protein
MYDLLRNERDFTEKASALKHLKAKIVPLNSTYYKTMMVDNGEKDKQHDEEPSLFRLLKATKRQAQRTIHTLQNTDGSMFTTSQEILHAFQIYFTTKYDTISIQQDCLYRFLSHTTARITDAANMAFVTPITPGELQYTIKQGKKNKAPGFNGICQEFLQTFWDVTKTKLLQILNDMYMNLDIEEQQKYRLLVCLLKHKRATSVNEYRPLTILNRDFKMLTRVIANRLKPWMSELLSPSQHCGFAGTTVFDALVSIRDAVTYADVTHKPMCIVSLDFQGAFDHIAHEYLFAILHTQGFSDRFVQRIRSLYTNAASSVQINGYTSKPIPIKSSIIRGAHLV